MNTVFLHDLEHASVLLPILIETDNLTLLICVQHMPATKPLPHQPSVCKCQPGSGSRR